ncbi:MAG: ureidoglycolate lyase [Lachnospiraceae bacterium]|nr:ureidoglycolate lyase [Lachnospiraceae bacterium]
MKTKVQEIDAGSFAPYGRYISMLHDETYIMHSSGDSFEDHMTKEPLIDTQGHLGYTVGSTVPCIVRSMEKHFHTEEALFCAAEAIVLVVAASRGELPPQAEDIRAFILRPGDVAVLNRNVWHDACRGLGKKTGYYYLASRGAAPADWIAVDGEAAVEL